MSGKVKIHVRLVPVTEICDRILRPLVRLRQKHATAEMRVDVRAQFLQIDVRLRKIFAVRPFPLVEIRNGIEPQAVDAKAEPEIADLLHQFVHCWIVEIQIRLMRIKAMPVICFRNRVPRPVRGLKIFEDDARVFVFFRRVAPDIELALGRTRRSAARFLEPRVLIGGMVDNELGDDAKSAFMRGIRERRGNRRACRSLD